MNSEKKNGHFIQFICTNCSEYSKCTIARCDRNKLLKYWKISANYYDGWYIIVRSVWPKDACAYPNNTETTTYFTHIYQTCIISTTNNRPPADPKTFAMVRFGHIVVERKQRSQKSRRNWIVRYWMMNGHSNENGIMIVAATTVMILYENEKKKTQTLKMDYAMITNKQSPHFLFGSAYRRCSAPMPGRDCIHFYLLTYDTFDGISNNFTCHWRWLVQRP